jgi:mannose-1-phosphate guanylyltransferase
LTTFPTRALVLTAGRGTRLGALSGLRAKPALPVAGEPLVHRTLRWLAREGVRDVVLNLHHRPETITAVVGDGSDLGVRVRYSWEDPLLGSAGGPRHALPLLDTGRFWIVNGDTVHTLSLGAMAATHEARAAQVTMALVPNRWPDRYGGVVVRNGSITGFLPPDAGSSSYHFIGIQLAESAVFAGLPDGEPAETVSGIYRPLIAGASARIAAFLCDVGFRDVGTPADYLATALALSREEGHGDVIPCGIGTRVDPTARLLRTVVWDDVTIERGVELTECIVTDQTRVPAGTRLTRCLVGSAGAFPAQDSGTGLSILPIDGGAP